MLTFFTTAKPFHAHSAIIQRNALQSWKLLHPDVEVILFGNDAGAAEVCAELDLRHEPQVDRHESGMKYLNYMFKRAQEIARHNYLCYSNCDIVLMNDFWDAFHRATEWRDRFLLISRRWDTDVTEAIPFRGRDWAVDLRKFALSTGYLQDHGFIDFFAFSKGLYDIVPPLVVGRSYWDHWIVWKALNRGVPVVDLSRFIVPVHQNHAYGYHPDGKFGTHTDALAIRNFEIAGRWKNLRCIADATHRMTRDGRIVRSLTRYKRDVRDVGRFLLHDLWEPIWFSMLNLTRPVRNRLGLRSKQVRQSNQ